MTANHYSFHLRTMCSSVPETVSIGVTYRCCGGIVTRPIPALDDVRCWQHLADLSVSQLSPSREKRSISIAIAMARAAKKGSSLGHGLLSRSRLFDWLAEDAAAALT